MEIVIMDINIFTHEMDMHHGNFPKAVEGNISIFMDDLDQQLKIPEEGDKRMIVSIDHTQDIEGDVYKEFIEWCFKYSSCLSLLDYRAKDRENVQKLITQLAPHIILRQETKYYQGYDKCFLDYFAESNHGVPTLYLFQCNDEIKDWVLGQSNTLFGWRLNLLEDIMFYRKNQTPLLHTTSHEGICWVSCTSEEYDDLPCKELWTIQDETELDDDWYF